MVNFDLILKYCRRHWGGAATQSTTHLDGFKCSGAEALVLSYECNGSGHVSTLRLDVTPCPRLLRDPGFIVDLRGATTMAIPVVEDETLQLQTVCPNLPPLQREATPQATSLSAIPWSRAGTFTHTDATGGQLLLAVPLAALFLLLGRLLRHAWRSLARAPDVELVELQPRKEPPDDA